MIFDGFDKGIDPVSGPVIDSFFDAFALEDTPP